MEPLTGWPKDVLNELIEHVSLINSRKSVKKFYIGRTVDVDNRKSDHSCDEIEAIYSTDSPDNAIVIEDILIKKFYNYNKCINNANHGGGGVSEEYGSYVYVAIWLTR